MKTAVFISSIAALLSQVDALAIRAAPQIDDTDVLNFALTLEHLENNFYAGALGKFDAQAFAKAGFPPFVRKRFEQISAHEATHVKFLETALGDKATQACTYSFPYTDPKSFTALSQIFETVGTSAYMGAAQEITSKAILTDAANILAVEGRHASWVASAVNKGAGWNGAFDTPLTIRQVITLATPFIVTCPSTNPPLPAGPFPLLTLAGTVSPGSTVSVQYTASGVSPATPVFVAFVSGLDQTFVPVNNGKVTIPNNLEGAVFAIVTTNNTSVTDDDTVAGPAILEFPLPSSSPS